MEKIKNSVLIVDDEAMNLTALSHMLKHDYTVYIEKDGVGCIEAAKEFKPDLILLDILMPAMNGFEVIAVLKKDESVRDIPVIFVTGLNNAKDEEMGFVLGASDYISKPFSTSVVKLRVRNQIQIINQKRRIRELTITDYLTGIGNRGWLYTQLTQEWHRAKRQKTPASLMMLDVDNFRGYNEAHGHLQGDAALKEIARIIKTTLSRAMDIAACWGGEEFAVLLPDTALPGALVVAEKIRAAVEQHAFMVDGKTPSHVTVSIGVHCTTPVPNGPYTQDNFVSDADRALHLAKAAGGNMVSVLEPA